MIIFETILNGKLKLTLVLFLVWILTVPFSSNAQDCNPAQIVKLPGIYKGPVKGSVSGISKEDLAKQELIIQKLSKIVLDNYSPKGMNITYGPAHFSPSLYQPNGIPTGNRYSANFFLKYFYCNNNRKMEEIAETHSRVEIRVNEWHYPSSFFVRKSTDEEDPETEVFGTIKNLPVWNENGYWTMTDTVYTIREIIHSHFIVSKDRKMPFIFMTKKEFLEKLRKYYQNKIEVTVNEWKNPLPEEAEYARERIEEDKAYYGKSLKNIDNFLAGSADAILNQPATVVSGGPPSEFDDFSQGRYLVIKPNPDYYKTTVPKSTPHFIDVLFMIHEPEVACLNAKNDILKIIDFKMLQSVVDKGGIQ